MRSRLVYAGFGILATVVGMATGHFVASLLHPDSSPVLAVGSTVIDHTPVGLKEWAIRHFGSNDKKILIGSVLAGVVVLAAVAGLLAKKRLAYGLGLVVVLVVVAGAAVTTRPRFGFVDIIPSVVTLATGLAALWWLDRTVRVGLAGRTAPTASTTPTTTAPAPTSEKPRTVLTSADDELVVQIGERVEVDVERPGATRRGVLIAAGVLAVASAVLGGAGKLIGNLRAKPEDIVLPQPATPAPPFPKGLDQQVPGITPLRISNDAFYRVDTRLDTPVVSSSDWTLTVDGMVDHPLEITFDELLAMPMVERDITLTCVSNSVGGKFVGGTRWLGVPLKTILDRAGIQAGSDQMMATDFDGMTIGTPVDLLTDGREALLAVGMNGVQLPREHGFPVRVIVPGLYGFISATKWVTKLTFTTYAAQESYWTQRKWGTNSPIKPSARIDTPKSLANIPKGDTVVGGVAWAQNDMGVAKVQVQIDGGGWQEATLGPDVDNIYWRQWFYKWNAASGQHTVAARVVDGAGTVQTAARAEPFPDGASGIHTLVVTVA